MEVSNLRTWQWMLVGLFVGAAIGMAWWVQPPEVANRARMSPRQFANAVGDSNRDGLPYIKDITVFTGFKDFREQDVTFVTFNRLAGSDGEYQPSRIEATGEIETGGRRNPQRYASVMDFLSERAEQDGVAVNFSRAVPIQERAGYGAAAGFVGIGMVWPLVLRLMGYKHEPRQKRAKPVKMPRKARKKLEAAQAKLNFGKGRSEDDLGITVNAKPASKADAADKPLPTFASRPPEPIERPQAPTPPQDKSFEGGEFYPVSRSGKTHE